MPEFIYQMRAVRKAHGDKVILDNVTLAFLPGAKIGVLGPNGTGKSTLLRMMAGVEQPSNGDARLMPGFTVGILDQEPALDNTKTVLGNVEAMDTGTSARGVIGDEVPLTALDDAVRVFQPDHILIGLRVGESADWQEPHLVETVRGAGYRLDGA